MDNNRVCPVERAGSLDTKIRRWVQNPKKIIGPFIQEGMTVVDLGCGPGFFTIDMAQMVGNSGRVFAVDLQDGMLEKLKAKIQGTELENRINLHKCEANNIGVSEQADFILAFYMIHELPDQIAFFREMKAILKPEGQMLIVEPSFHVSKKAFEKTVEIGRSVGLAIEKGPKVFLGKTVVIKKGGNHATS